MRLTTPASSLAAPLLAVPGVFERVRAGALFVFNYHDVTETPSRFCLDFDLAVSPDLFTKQLTWIRDHFNVIGPHQLLADDFEPPAAMVTFDDGFRGAFSEGGRRLKAAGLPAVVFLNMAPILGQVFWSGLVTYLSLHHGGFRTFIEARRGPLARDFYLYCTPQDVQAFIERHGDGAVAESVSYAGAFARPEDLAGSAANGLFLGNHLFNHYNAAQLPPDDLREQFLRNDAALSQYPNHVPLFSYPFGQPRTCYNATTDRQLLALGAARVFTAFPLANHDRSATRLHRVSMHGRVDSGARFLANTVVPARVNQLFRRQLDANA